MTTIVPPRHWQFGWIVGPVKYRVQAAHFRELAETEQDDALQDKLLNLAQEYDRLAAQLDRGSNQQRDA